MAGKYHSKTLSSYQPLSVSLPVGAGKLQALTIFDQLLTRDHITTGEKLQTLGIWLAPGFEPRTSLMKTSALPLCDIQTSFH